MWLKLKAIRENSSTPIHIKDAAKNYQVELNAGGDRKEIFRKVQSFVDRNKQYLITIQKNKPKP